MQELLPIASGFVAGSLLGLLRPSLRIPVGTVLAVAFGALATIVTGEFRTSWAFLVVDTLLVAFAALAGLLAVRLALSGRGRTRAP